MKKLYAGMLLVIIAVACKKEANPDVQLYGSPETIVIQSGISYNECMGYCRGELTITQTRCSFKRISNNGQKVQTCSWPTNPDAWNRLLSKLDTHQLATVALPACAHAPDEWIEVRHSGRLYQTSFRTTDSALTALPLVAHLHQLYAQIKQHPCP